MDLVCDLNYDGQQVGECRLRHRRHKRPDFFCPSTILFTPTLRDLFLVNGQVDVSMAQQDSVVPNGSGGGSNGYGGDMTLTVVGCGP